MYQIKTTQNHPQPQSGHTFSAKEKDDETAYSYFGARYYDSDLSVWLSVDPMSDKHPNFTAYAFCFNNPINFKDPLGLDTIPFNNRGEFGKPIPGGNDKMDTYVKVNGKEFNNNKIDYNKKGKLRGRHKHMDITSGFYNTKSKLDGAEFDTDLYELFDYEKAKSVFEFFSDNTNVEWTHSICLKDDEAGSFNTITTSHKVDRAGLPGPGYISDDGYTVADQRHSHLGGYFYSKQDKGAYDAYQKIRPISMHIYKGFKYTRFDSEKENISDNKIKSY